MACRLYIHDIGIADWIRGGGHLRTGHKVGTTAPSNPIYLNTGTLVQVFDPNVCPIHG